MPPKLHLPRICTIPCVTLMGPSENRNLFSVVTHTYIKMIYIGFIRGIDYSTFYDFAIRFAMLFMRAKPYLKMIDKLGTVRKL